jgi:hypothetical protein
MSGPCVSTIATLRAAVGFLGERGQAGWWQSSFFAPGGSAFLAPIFGRTQTLAQCTAVRDAAALIHDERIGVGHVYHLFRLPEDLEQRVHAALHEPDLIGAIGEVVSSRDRALEYLREQAEPVGDTTAGPARAGDLKDLRSPTSWSGVAALYLLGLESGVEVFPYFAGGE